MAVIKDDAETIVQNNTEWHDAIPLTEGKKRTRPLPTGHDEICAESREITPYKIKQSVL